MKAILDKWRCLNLSLEGNILIAKTFGLSQFIHLMQVITIPLDDLKKIEAILFNFIWRGVDKIKRLVLMSDFEFGGLKAPDPISLNLCMKIKNYFRLSFSTLSHPIKSVWINKMTSYNLGRDLCELSESEYLKNLKNNSDFSVSCINSFRFYNYLWKSHLNFIKSDPCHINYKISYAKAQISTVINNRSRDIANRLQNVFGINTIIELLRDDNANLFLEKNSIMSQLPTYIKTCLVGNVIKYEAETRGHDPNILCCGLNHWVNYKKLKALDITNLKRLVSGVLNGNDVNYFLHNKYTTKNVRIRDFQFKLLHGITSTRSKLFKFKYIPDEWCLKCLDAGLTVKDNIAHSFYNCPASTLTWIEFEKVCKDKYNVEINLNLENCIKSFCTSNKIIDEASIHIKKLLHCPMSIRKIIKRDQILKIFESIEKIKKCCKK